MLVSNPSVLARDFAGLLAVGSCFSFFDLRTAAAAARIAGSAQHKTLVVFLRCGRVAF